MVSEKDVSYVADLACLELTDEERGRMFKDLNSILGYIDRLNELDTTDIEPMAQAGTHRETTINPTDPFGYVLRADELRPSLPREEALRNAPVSDGIFFKVPKVIER